MQSTDLGRAHIQPNEVVEAGAFITVTYTYIAEYPIDETGYLKIVFRQVSDFGTPQFDNPSKPNYCTVHTTGNCRIRPRWENRGHRRPWTRALFLRIADGFLDKEENIVVVFGDRSKGSSGWQIQTFCEDTFEFKTLVDPIATYGFKAISESPTLSIVPGSPVRAVCITSSQIRVNEGFTYYLKLEDRWGNPVGKPIEKWHSGFTSDGVQTIVASDEKTGLSARSNPIEVTRRKTYLHPLWADFHGQTEETVGTNTIEDYYTFARDYSLLDICAHQGNDFEVTDDFWKAINTTAHKFYQKGVFVTFPGYEWSGNTPLGGDRNVFFISEDGHITRSSTELLFGKRSKFEDSPTAEDLFKNLKNQSIPTFVFAHAGGRYSDLSIHDSDIELAVEVHSAWGTFEWLVEDALKKGYRIGICANSDGHKCRPGASYPGATEFGSLGGLTCVLSQRLDRKGIYEALKARHFYATTGNRSLINLRLTTDDGETTMMGDVVAFGKSTPILNVNIAGTNPTESVAVRNGLDTFQVLRPYSGNDLGNRIKIIWGGAEVRGRARIVRWDGNLHIHNNRITNTTAINFWNANQPLKQLGWDQLEWQSITTGGVAGVIVELEEANAGSLEVKTLQRRIEINIESIGMEPVIWDCGGLHKRIEIYRLPSRQNSSEFSFNLPLTALHEGDNSVYVRVVQEDGHMAWTSPVYLKHKI
jgi:hypothetical protein